MIRNLDATGRAETYGKTQGNFLAKPILLQKKKENSLKVQMMVSISK